MHTRESTLRVWVAGTITVLWAISFTADIFIPDYDPPASMGALMLLLAGALFGEGVVKQVRRPSEEDHGE